MSVFARQQNSHFFLYNGERVYVSNVINRNGRLYYPIRESVENLALPSLEVDWEGHTQTVVITNGGVIVRMTVGSPILEFGHPLRADIQMSTTPFLHTDNRMYVPFRYTFESGLSWNVTFNESLRVPEARIGRPPETASSTTGNSIDIKRMHGRRFEDVQHLFGNSIEVTSGMYEIHRFDTGALVGIGRLIVFGNDIVAVRAITIDYERIANRSDFNFDGIDGTSTYDDVILRYGEPDNIRSEDGVRARVSYGYLIDGAPFVRFFFNDNNDVVAIEFHDNIQGGRR